MCVAPAKAPACPSHVALSKSHGIAFAFGRRSCRARLSRAPERRMVWPTGRPPTAVRARKFQFSARDATMNGTRFASIASGALLLLSGSALHARTRPPVRLQMDECKLLTIADASKALEQSSQPGKHMTEGTPPGCL